MILIGKYKIADILPRPFYHVFDRYKSLNQWSF